MRLSSGTLAILSLALFAPTSVKAQGAQTWAAYEQQQKGGAWREMIDGFTEKRAEGYATRHCINPGAVPAYATKYADKATGAEHVIVCEEALSTAR